MKPTDFPRVRNPKDGRDYAVVPVEVLEGLLIAAEQDDSEEGIWNRQKTAAKEITRRR